MPNLGVWEILLILLVVLIVFGPKRLPEMGRSLGRGMREFKNSLSSAVPTQEELEGRPEQDRSTARPVPVAVQATAVAPASSSGASEAAQPSASERQDGPSAPGASG